MANNYAVAASADDAREVGGTVTLTTNSIVLTGATHYIGLSFPTAATPLAQAAGIALAELTYYEVADGTANLVWKGHKVTNSAQFTTTTNDVSNRYSSAATTAAVTDSGAVLVGTRTVNVTSIVQELVNQAGWSSTSRLTLIGNKAASGAIDMQIRAFDYGSGFATLVVTLAGGAKRLVGGVRLTSLVGGLL